MGLCGGKEQPVLEKAGQGILTVYGDYFSPETRTILAALGLSNIKCDLQIIDQFKGEHKTEKFQGINPAMSHPAMSEGRFLVIGGYIVFLKYLINHHKQIKEKLYPQEFANQIDTYLNWFQSILRISSMKLIRMIIGPQAFGEKAPSKEKLQAAENEFYEIILPILDKKIGDYEYICGDEADITIVDIQIYNEIITILTLQKRELNQNKYPSLSQWVKRMQSHPEVVEMDKRLKEILLKYNFI